LQTGLKKFEISVNDIETSMLKEIFEDVENIEIKIGKGFEFRFS